MKILIKLRKKRFIFTASNAVCIAVAFKDPKPASMRKPKLIPKASKGILAKAKEQVKKKKGLFL